MENNNDKRIAELEAEVEDMTRSIKQQRKEIEDLREELADVRGDSKGLVDAIERQIDLHKRHAR